MIIIRGWLQNNYKKDGWFSWIICLFAFITNATIVGIDKSFGETLGSITDAFNVTTSEAAWIASTHSSIQYFAAFISSMLAQKYGFSFIMFLGSTLAGTGFAVATMSRDVTTLTILYGVVGGLGLGLAYTPGNIICSFYFRQKRSLATGIAVAGSALGIVVISYLINLMGQSYGWKGWLIVCSSICPTIWFLAFTAWLVPETSDEYSDIESEHAHHNQAEEEQGYEMLYDLCNIIAYVIYIYSNVCTYMHQCI